MNTRQALRFVMNLLLALALAAGPALAVPSMPGQAAAVADASEPPCHGAPPPADESCAGGCCADASCDPGACRMMPVLMASVPALAAAASPFHPQPVRSDRLMPSPHPGVALRPPIA